MERRASTHRVASASRSPVPSSAPAAIRRGPLEPLQSAVSTGTLKDCLAHGDRHESLGLCHESRLELASDVTERAEGEQCRDCALTWAMR